MDLVAAETAIRSRAEALWSGIEPSVPLTWPNESFDKPPDGNGAPASFVRLDVVWNGGDGITIGAPGNNIARRDGHIWAYAFTAQGIGVTMARQLASEAAGMFEDEDFSGVVCEAAQPGGDADEENGNYYGFAVAVPFYYDETI